MLTKTEKWVVLYYALLLFIFMSWHNFDAVPGAMMRIAYLAAVILPAMIKVQGWLPMIMTIFYSIMSAGFTSSYMPAEKYTFVVTVALCAFMFGPKHFKYASPPPVLIVLLVEILFINSISVAMGQQIDNFMDVPFTFILMIILSMYAGCNSEKYAHYFSFAFIIAGLLLCIQYNLFSAELNTIVIGDNLERYGFRDINYSACVIGMGAFAAFLEYNTNKSLSKIMKVLLLVYIVFVLYTLVRNASRGSLTACAASCIVVLLTSKMKNFAKMFLILVLFGAIYFMQFTDVADVFVARVENDELSTGRFSIWGSKLAAFFDGDAFHILFGYGQTGGRAIGINESAHNDFISFLTEFGIIGLVTFVVYFLYPIKVAKNNKKFVIAGLAYALVVSLTLEPLCKGLLPYHMFWLYLIYLSFIQEENTVNIS